MEQSSNFKFLNMQEISRKNANELKEEERTFLKINLLDYENNPCSFMIFGDKKQKILDMNLQSLEDLVITYRIFYSNNKWNVSFIDVDVR